MDDEHSILDALASYLSASGYQVHPFLNATIPLSKIQQGHHPPDAIICDIMMPNLSGIDFLSLIRSNPTTSNIPFILLTAKSLVEDRIVGYNAGTDGYLMKPFDPDELVAILNQVIQRREYIIESDNSMSVNELRTNLAEVKDLLFEEKSLLKSFSQSSENVNPLLTPEEMDVLKLLCEGYMNKEVASELQYSVRWVESQLTNLFRKSSCTNRTELVKWALSNEYVEM